jgi:hypothetical protein
VHIVKRVVGSPCTAAQTVVNTPIPISVPVETSRLALETVSDVDSILRARFSVSEPTYPDVDMWKWLDHVSVIVHSPEREDYIQ